MLRGLLWERFDRLWSIPAQVWLARLCFVAASVGLVLLGRLPLLLAQAVYAWTFGLVRQPGFPLDDPTIGLALYQQIVGPLDSFVFTYPWLWPLMGALGLLLHTTAPASLPLTSSRSNRAIWLALFLAALGVGLWIRIAPLWNSQAAAIWTLDYDEGVYVSAARTWLQGSLPYRDVWLSHPPTGIAILTLVAAGDHGPTMLVAARRMTALLDVITALLMLWVGRELGGWRVGMVAAGVYLLDGIAGRNSTHVWLETAMNGWSVAAVGCALYGVRRNAVGWLVAAGACAMLAATTKYVGVAVLAAILISLSAHRQWRKAAIILGSSVLVLVLGLLVTMPLGWGNLLRQTVLAQALRAPHHVPAIDRTALAVATPASVLTVLIASIGAMGVFRRRSLPALGWVLVLTWLALVFAILMHSPVFYLHYVTQLLAPLALCCGGIATFQIAASWQKRLAIPILLLVVGPLLALQLRSLPEDGPSWDIQASAERIRARTPADQPVMTFEPLYNLFSDRDFMRAPDGRLLIDSYMHLPGMTVKWSSSVWRDLWQILVRRQPAAPAPIADPVTTMLVQAPFAVFAPSRAPTTVEQAVVLASEYRHYPLPSAMLYERLPRKREVMVESLKIRGIVAPTEVVAGQKLQVAVLWQMLWAESRTPYLSLQLVDVATHKWGQYDKPVGPEGAPFWAWKPGPKIYEDIVDVPIDPAVPAGTYRLILVVYDPTTGQPWQLTDDTGHPIALPYVVDEVTVPPR